MRLQKTRRGGIREAGRERLEVPRELQIWTLLNALQRLKVTVQLAFSPLLPVFVCVASEVTQLQSEPRGGRFYRAALGRWLLLTIE